MLFSKSPLSIHGFFKPEILEINAKTHFEAARILGQETRSVTKKTLERNLKHNKTKALEKCQKELDILNELSHTSYFKIGNINYLKRYLDSLTGFSEGVGITLTEAAFLQKEIQTGCQTFIARNETGEIAFMHTEENSQDDNVYGDYNYRLVRMKLPEKEVVFFQYPGLCSWGPAFGIDETNKLAQFVDDLLLKDKLSGSLWSNAITSMIFDTGDIKKAIHLLQKMVKVAKKYGFSTGYAVHLVQNKKGVDSLSFEFGAKMIKRIGTSAKYFVQVNLAKSSYFEKITDYYPPKHKKSWTNDQKMEYVEMTRREARLENICRMSWWDTSSPDRTIETGLKVLAYPYGDLRRWKDKEKGLTFYHTGLPSRWTFAHFIGFFGKKSKLYIGKNTPQPIKGMEYSNIIDENYKYAEEKIWELIKVI